MKPREETDPQLLIQAWIDGELEPSEARKIAARVESDPQARALAENLRAFSSLLHDHPPARAVPEPRDFYWSRIRQGIESTEAQAEAQAQPRPSATFHPLRWLAWLVPVGAAAFAAMLFLRPMPSPDFATMAGLPATPLTNHEVETPSKDVSSLTFYASQESMTVVWLGTIDFL